MTGVRHRAGRIAGFVARIVAVPDATVRGLRAELAERGTKTSNDAVWRFLRRRA